MVRYLLLFVWPILTACASSTPKTDYNFANSEEFAKGIHESFSPYSGVRYLEGPRMEYWQADQKGVNKTVTSLMRKQQGQVDVLQVRVSVLYTGGWRMYDQAYFKGGRSAEIVPAKREVISCSGRASGCLVSETILVNVSPEILKDAKSTGFNLAVSSRGGFEAPAFISPLYLSNFLESWDGSSPNE